MSQKLTFTTTSLLNTTISNATDTIYYDIQTPENEPQLTIIRRLDTRTNRYNLTGTIQNQAGNPVAVNVLGRPTKQGDQWIKNVSGDLPGERCERYVAAIADSCHKLRGADEGVRTKRALATFHPYRRYLMVGWISQHAYLEMDNSILSSVDAIIRERIASLFSRSEHSTKAESLLANCRAQAEGSNNIMYTKGTQ
ncbi:hypothetical protein EDD15DRAFT_2166747 [Pisolithus albus]|nr:hypothetical protein EDD15DRAFT_2166747 [Pisolithus albus]